MTPDPDISTLDKLYHSGAWLCLAIVVAYLLLRFASAHVAWLQVPGRAHYVTAILAGGALIVVPAAQGTTPNISMIVAAFSAAIALFLRGAPVAAAPVVSGELPIVKDKESGFVDRGLLGFLATFAIVVMVACGAGIADKAIDATLIAAKTSHDLYLVYDDTAQSKCTIAPKDKASGQACLDAVKATQVKVEPLFAALKSAIEAAQKARDAATVTTMAAAAKTLADGLRTAGVTP